MKNARFIQFSFALSAAVILFACASSPKKDAAKPDEPQRPRVASGLVAKPVAMVFAAMDTDRDALITGPEAASGINEEWQRADANADGQATPIEISAWAKITLGDENALPNWISFDTDLDQTVSEREFSERLRQDFARLDRNKDGALARTELLSQIRGAGRQRGANRPADAGQNGQRPQRRGNGRRGQRG